MFCRVWHAIWHQICLLQPFGVPGCNCMRFIKAAAAIHTLGCASTSWNWLFMDWDVLQSFAKSYSLHLLCLVEVQRMMQAKLVVSESASITYKVVVWNLLQCCQVRLKESVCINCMIWHFLLLPCVGNAFHPSAIVLHCNSLCLIVFLLVNQSLIWFSDSWCFCCWVSLNMEVQYGPWYFCFWSICR